MLCSGCQGTNFQQDDGKLICEDCGEELIGFQEETVDDYAAGTALTNRTSQSSQALSKRESLRSRRASQQHEETKSIASSTSIPQFLVYEGAFHILKSITDKLIELKYATARIRKPLFHILSHWIQRQHSEKPFQIRKYRTSKLHYLLSIVALASCYIRSPLLPRDICRLAITRKIPYLTALSTNISIPLHISQNETVRMTLSTNILPSPKKIILTAHNLVLGKYAWPPLRKMYGHFTKQQNIYTPERANNIPSSFPVGHLTITLLRIIRLVGLPDEFGARVLRWRELCLRAFWSTEHEKEHGKPWDVKDIIRPTEDELVADIICVMRICYGRRVLYGGSVLMSRAADMEKEWEQCKHAMARWLKIGNPEDIDTVMWSGLSPDVLQTISGKQLSKYVSLANAILTQRGEKGPELWGPFIHEFENVANPDDLLRNLDDDESEDEDDNVDQDENSLLEESNCMYDTSKYDLDSDDFNLDEGIEDMELECIKSSETSESTKRKRLLNPSFRKRRMREKQKSENVRQEKSESEIQTKQEDRISLEEPFQEFGARQITEEERHNEADQSNMAMEDIEYSKPITKFQSASENDNTQNAQDFNCAWEPAGIGLAWTIMIRFFEGTNVDISGMEHEQNGQLARRMGTMLRTMDKKMKTTFEFIQDYGNNQCDISKVLAKLSESDD